jgi:hypothetical protein
LLCPTPARRHPLIAVAHAGAPDLDFFEAVKLEHCKKGGHDFEFETSNYKIRTTSHKEYSIVLGKVPADAADMMHGRRIPDLEALRKLEMSTSAKLLDIEIIMLVLYTGPMVASESMPPACSRLGALAASRVVPCSHSLTSSSSRRFSQVHEVV